VSTYIFDNDAPQTEDRFDILQSIYDKFSIERLTELGIGPGWHCLEVGGGGGSMANWIADRVGPTGSVLVTDINLSRLQCGAATVEVRRHDIVDDELPTSEFDLVHIRLVLGLLPGRLRALRRIHDALKPGGLLVLDEFDCSYLPVFSAPDDHAAALYTKVTGAVHQLIEDYGGDHVWSNHALAAMQAAGFTGLTQRSRGESWQGGSHGIQLHRVNAQQMQNQLIDRELITRNEYDSFLELIDNPTLVVNSYLMHTIWGRRAQLDPLHQVVH